MGVLNEAMEKLLKFFISLKGDDWVRWIAQKNDWQDDCDKFDDCYFIVKNMPKYPHHVKCQCRLEKINKPIPNVTANAACDIRKFTDYIFSEKYKDGKKELFESWGYTQQDSAYLQKMYISQALQKYCDGDYIYKGTNGFSARIEIVVDIETKSGKTVYLKTGWILLPKGEIKLSTPFSGFKD